MHRQNGNVLFTARTLAWLQHSSSGRILHLFDQSCNLLNEHGVLISLVLPTVGLGPFSLIIPKFVMEKLRQGEPVVVGNGLRIGEWRLGVGDLGTEIWDARPEWARLRGVAWDSSGLRPFESPIEERFRRLLDGMQRGDETAVVDAAHELAGLGHGLTPTGDDILMGILYALWVYRPGHSWIRKIGETAAMRTTTLSAAFLQAAVDGEATAHWHALTIGDPQAVRRILTIGKTSGFDAWRGFVYTSSVLRDQFT